MPTTSDFLPTDDSPEADVAVPSIAASILRSGASEGRGEIRLPFMIMKLAIIFEYSVGNRIVEVKLPLCECFIRLEIGGQEGASELPK